MSRVQFHGYAAPPDRAHETTAVLSGDVYELRLTADGIEARMGDYCCTYPLGTVRQWWAG